MSSHSIKKPTHHLTTYIKRYTCSSNLKPAVKYRKDTFIDPCIIEKITIVTLLIYSFNYFTFIVMKVKLSVNHHIKQKCIQI